jgi:glycosyltransferase involved in cell wall biosynthesis
MDIIRRIFLTRNRRFDQTEVIHAFDCRPTAILPALALRRRTGARLVIDWADWWGRGGTIDERHRSKIVRGLVRPVETYFEEAFRRRADVTTVISTALANRAERLGVSRATITVIPQGCNGDSIYPMDIGLCRRRCSLSEDVPILGHLGSLLRSDVDLMLRLISDIRSVKPEARLLMIGNPKFRIPVQPGVIQTGFVSESQLAFYVGACNFFVVPLADTIANRARWPSKVNKYFEAGRPLVTSRVGDLPALVERWNIGRVGDLSDGSFQQSCLELIANPRQVEEYGRRARNLAETDLSWDRIAKNVLSLYRIANGQPAEFGMTH